MFVRSMKLRCQSSSRTGSVIQQLKIVDPLVIPTTHGGKASAAFHVVIPAPRSWAERAYLKLILYNKLDKGGRFAA